MKFLEAQRAADAAASLPERRLRLCLSGTVAPLDLYLRAYLARAGQRGVIDTLPFGTLQQYLRSGEIAAATDVLLLTPWDLLPSLDWRLGLRPESLTLDAARAQLQEIERLLGDTEAPLFYLPAAVPPAAQDDVLQRRLESELHATALRLGARILSADAFGLSAYLAYGTPVSAAAASDIAAAIVSALTETSKPRRKLLVSDLDGVMWHGVVGEDGPDGLLFAPEGKGYPHYIYQTLLKRLRAEGVLLSVASRNDADLARAPLRNAQSVLKEDDFVAIKTGYGEKSALIQQLAQKLSLGTDSFVFVDDNPVEVAEVRARLPEVACLQFPSSPDGLPALLSAMRDHFPSRQLTEEDRRRTELYRQRLASAVPEGASGASVEEFLRGLEMRLIVADRSVGGRERAVQLINKTNQFNLNGLRLSDDVVAQTLANGGRLLVATLEDKHGSHGEILACLVEGEARIAALVMSCRVLQRGAEHAFVRWLATGVLRSPSVRFAFQVTERNEPLRRFLTDLGLDAAASGDIEMPVPALQAACAARADLLRVEVGT